MQQTLDFESEPPKPPGWHIVIAAGTRFYVCRPVPGALRSYTIVADCYSKGQAEAEAQIWNNRLSR